MVNEKTCLQAVGEWGHAKLPNANMKWNPLEVCCTENTKSAHFYNSSDEITMAV
jgi:hypothetical protein